MRLRTRLWLGFGAIILAMVVAAVVIWQSQYRTLVSQLDTNLLLLKAPAMGVYTRGAADEPLSDGLQRVLADNYVWVVASDGSVKTLLAPVGADGSTPVVTTGDGYADPASVPMVGGSGASVRVVGQPGPDGNTVLLGQSLATVDAEIQALLRNLLVIDLALAGLVTLIFWWIMRLGLRPITQITAVARDISGGETSQRVGQFPAGTEAQELGQAFNLLVDQTHESQEKLRQFVADASHELRTPLTALMGYTSLYAQGGLADDEAVSDAMRRMKSEAGRMSGMVNDLLLLATLDIDPQLHVTEVDLVAVVTGLIEDLRVIDPTREITVTAPDHLWVRGDQERLTQVVGILLDNARKYTTPGSTISIDMTTGSAQAWIRITDEGPGMSAADADKVFDRFYRAESSRTKPTGGSGLGLPIAAAIVTAHHGTIDVTSEPEAGSTFTVSLPTMG